MIFWENEPTLNPMYSAVREYLEIKPRIQVLNERCKVFLDLAEILSDAIADKKMTSKLPFPVFDILRVLTVILSDITWIIIILIIISIFVTCSEVFLRFGLLSSSKNKPFPSNMTDNALAIENSIVIPLSPVQISSFRSIARANLVISWILTGISML